MEQAVANTVDVHYDIVEVSTSTSEECLDVQITIGVVYKVGSITMISNCTRQYALITIPLLHIIPGINPTGALPSGRYGP